MAKSTKATKATTKAAATKAAAVAAKAVAVASPKCAHAYAQVGKPNAKMLRVISKVGKHPGKALRIKRWAKYAKGQTLQHCKTTDGLDHLDVLFYVEHGLMELRNATTKEVEAAVATWQAAKPKPKA